MTIEELNKQIEEYNQEPRVIAYKAQQAEAARIAARQRYQDQQAERIAFEERVKLYNDEHRAMAENQ